MDIDYQAVLPEIVLAAAGILIMLVTPYVKPHRRPRLGFVALIAVALALGLSLVAGEGSGLSFFDTIFRDQFGQFCKILFLFAAGVVTLNSIHYLEREHLATGEFFSLVLFATTGMCLMVTSADLILTFLGLETLSIATYVLVGFTRRRASSGEAAWKYFILGAFATAFLLYGIALIYGTTGTTKYLQIASEISGWTQTPFAAHLGLGLLLAGFGFKIALVPFHIWTPDVYEGAPIPTTAHLAVGVKAAAVLAFLRVLFQVVPDLSGSWQILLWISSVLTMTVGNLGALTQTNLKRILAYSSIAHAGYLLVGLTAHNALGAQGVLFYLAAYALMTLGTLAVIQILSGKKEKYLSLDDYAGLGLRFPFLGMALAVFLISLAGIPITAGFVAKLIVFTAAVQSEMYLLIVLAVVTSAVGLYYYIRIIVLLFMRQARQEMPPLAVPTMAQVAIAVMLLGTLYLGVSPGRFLSWTGQAASF